MALKPDDTFPEEQRRSLGVEGKRAIVILCWDVSRNNRRTALTLSKFAESVDEYRSRGCDIVAALPPGGGRPLSELSAEFPAITFNEALDGSMNDALDLGLEDMASLRAAVAAAGDDYLKASIATQKLTTAQGRSRDFFRAFLLEPDGKVVVVADELTCGSPFSLGAKATLMWATVTQALERSTADSRDSAAADAERNRNAFADKEVAMRAAAAERAERAEVIKADPSLAEPARPIWDGLFAGAPKALSASQTAEAEERERRIKSKVGEAREARRREEAAKEAARSPPTYDEGSVDDAFAAAVGRVQQLENARKGLASQGLDADLLEQMDSELEEARAEEEDQARKEEEQQAEKQQKIAEMEAELAALRRQQKLAKLEAELAALKKAAEGGGAGD